MAAVARLELAKGSLKNYLRDALHSPPDFPLAARMRIELIISELRIQRVRQLHQRAITVGRLGWI